MSYRFINPGHYTMMSEWENGANYLQDTSKTRMRYLNPNGVAISGTTRYEIPESSKKVWISYSASEHVWNKWAVGIRNPLNAKSANAMLVGLYNHYSYADGVLAVTSDDPNRISAITFFSKLITGTYNRVMVMVDTESGTIEVWMNSESVFRSTGITQLQKISDLKGCRIEFGGNMGGIANIIVSDEEIKPNEDVLVLGNGGIEADVQPDTDGVYTFTEVGQKYLQTPDVSKLADNDVITGVAALAQPAYSEADGLYHVTGISADESGTTTEHGQDAITSATNSGVVVSWPQALTKAELAKMKVGMVMAK